MQNKTGYPVTFALFTSFVALCSCIVTVFGGFLSFMYINNFINTLYQLNSIKTVKEQYYKKTADTKRRC